MVSEEVDAIRQALDALLLVRVQEKCWTDKAEAKLTGPIKTMEAISCFTSTALNLDALKKADSNFQLPKLDQALLVEDLQLRQWVAANGYAPDPYCKEDFDRIGVKFAPGKTDFVDTASFIVTTLLGALLYSERMLKEIPKSMSDFQNLAKDATNWLIQNAYEKNNLAYWSWGAKGIAPDVPSVYFTWSAAIGLAHAFQNKHSVSSKAEKDRMKQLLERALRWAESVIVKENKEDEADYEGERYAVDYKNIELAESFNGNALLVFLVGIAESATSVGVAPSEDKLQNIVDTLLSIFSKGDQDGYFGDDSHYVRYPDPKERIQYRDRSIDYILLSSLSWLFRQHKELKLRLPKERADLLRTYLDYQRRRVLRLRDERDKLWPAPMFRIYTTQRAVDCLNDWVRYARPYVVTTDETGIEDVSAVAILDLFHTVIRDNRDGLLKKIKEILLDQSRR